MTQAIHRLEFVVPFSLVLIAAVLFGATYSWIDTFVIMVQVPVASLGRILALLVSGILFSVSAAVGLISIFGIAVMDGMLLSSYISFHRSQDAIATKTAINAPRCMPVSEGSIVDPFQIF